MGLFDNIKKRMAYKKQERSYRYIMSNYYGNDFNLFIWDYAKQIYNIPEVRTAIETISQMFSTIPIYHKIVNKDGQVSYIDDDRFRINAVLNYQANPVQNSIAFWQSCITKLLLENNAFIEPISDTAGRLDKLYLLPYTNGQFRLSIDRDNAYAEFMTEPSVVKEKHNLKDIIYLSRFCNMSGGKMNNLGLYETVVQALGQKIVNICNPKKVKAILQGKLGTSPQLKPEDKRGVMENVRVNFADNVDGIAYLDDKWTVNAINWQENDVNKDLMSFIVNVVYNYFGISESIINGKANEIEMDLFINKTMKPLALQFERELTNKLFTQREFEFGHRIEFDVQALSISSLSSKTTLFSIASRNGVLNIDEMREYLGQPPLPDGLGKKYRVSADCVDIEIADKYQLGKFGINPVDKNTGNDIKSNNKEASDGQQVEA